MGRCTFNNIHAAVSRCRLRRRLSTLRLCLCFCIIDIEALRFLDTGNVAYRAFAVASRRDISHYRRRWMPRNKDLICHQSVPADIGDITVLCRMGLMILRKEMTLPRDIICFDVFESASDGGFLNISAMPISSSCAG